MKPSNKKKEVLLCPICGGKMKKGTGIIKSTVDSFLFFGANYQPLWFNKDKILEPNEVIRAYRCSECKATLVKDKLSTSPWL